MLFKRFSLLSLIVCSNLILITHTYAEEADYFAAPFQGPQFKPSQGNLGGVGLMQMPSGRMAEEGAFSFNYTKSSEYQFYSIALQLMPWLETTIRYTQVEDLLYSNDESFSGGTKYTDKGIDAKLRLLEESHWLPEVSVGLRDIGGTGLFDGEFIAATKRLSTDGYGQFDFTLGLGWGYFGTQGNISNPLCTAADRFCDRISGYSGNGGSIDYNRWFTGSTSLFGGVEYQTPYKPLRLKLEYDGNDYSQDRPVTSGGVDMTPRTPWNVGALYAVSDGFDIRLSYERGTTVALGFTLSTNFDTIKTPWVDDPIPALGTDQATTLDGVDWKKLDAELSKVAGYQTEKVYQEGDTVAIVSKQNSKYRDRDVAAERAAAVLVNHLPTDIQSYKIIEESKNIPVKSTEISAQGYRDIANVEYFNPSIKDAIVDLPLENIDSEPLYDNFEPLNYGFTPHLTQSVGSPEAFYLYSLTMEGDASYWLTNNLQLSSAISINMVDNYDKFNFEITPDGTSNYRVRTLVRAYVRDNDANVSNLQLTWFQKYGQNWYQQVYGGYLETMFAGAGTEVLYRQPNSNWAIGADINAIAQRDPDSMFGIFENDYAYGAGTKVLSRGTTGHLSFYYQPQWSFLEDTMFRVDMGKFLAADVGARFDFSKQYKSGVIVGAYASRTNMSAEDFGEGSFTKGFYLSIPFDTISLKPTNSRGYLNWQPITRDGGQMLGKRNSLYGITDMVSPWYQRPNQN
ncbi:Exopolysaccharide biosynthesis protein YbjH [Marinomonas polaris DSM 16579]|uniref:Exopolysaccharide biosynthesis protein YbjH n=1 Tax=Marinomonas polaris DSM 16579 TaxID=1122206 RepID=A0A1M5MB53_9GAMM|nr:YjbH domain-containing protein [Marinomonas polaris]SHG74508.1 Exopolysaccharide biosynthesis protein YbjH [Marinomonas polaris DSM 16579]